MLALRPRPAVLSARAREGAAGSRARRPDRAGLRAEDVRRRRALRRDRLGHRLGQRVGERDRRRARKCISLVRNPTPDEQDLNTPRCFFEALGIDAFQDLDFDQRIEFLGRILKGTAPHRRGWDAKIAGGPRRGPLRADHRRDRRDQAGPARPARAHHEQARRGPRLARRHRRRHAAPASTSRRSRCRCCAGWSSSTRCRSRRAGSSCSRTAASPASTGPTRGCAAMGIHANAVITARRHDRRPQVHRPPLRRRLLRGGEAEAAPVPVAARDAAVALATRPPNAIRRVREERSSSPDVPDRPRPRSQTRVAILIGPAILATILSLITRRTRAGS